MKILLVDDDLEDRHSFAEAAEKLDRKVQMSYARDSKELFAHLENNPDTHLVLLDINMPVRNGNQCLKQLKADERYKHIPVIMYTVSLSQADIDESFAGGAHYYVVKPYAQTNFLNTLEIIFGIDWEQVQPIPEKKDFVINFAFTK